MRTLALVLSLVGLSLLSACGTLTGLPAHGGGKRFATEQRLVSASIRAALKDLDVTALQGKRAALVFDLVADEGGGSFNGGRWSPGLLFSVGSVVSPVTSTQNAFQVYNLAEAGSNYSNSSSGGGSTSVGTTLQNGTSSGSGVNTANGSSTNTNNSSGTNTNTSSGSNTNTSTTNGSNTNNSTTTNSGGSSGGSTSTTGGTTTNSNFNQTDNSTNTTAGTGTNTSTTNGSGTNTSTTNGSGTNTSSGSGTNSSTGSGTGTNSSTSNSSNTGSNASNSTTTTSTSNTGTNHSSGGYNTNRESLTPSPTETITRTEGTKREHTATLAYRGLGEYQNFPVPKSDASLLMGLVRNYLLFSGVTPTTPNDPTAEVLVYVTVDIFGTVRSRFDALLYNNETVKAETSFEIAAFDREGKRIMNTQVANREAQYREHYLLWAGPISTREQVYQGQGLLVDFTDVDGSKPRYNPEQPVVREHLGGKN